MGSTRLRRQRRVLFCAVIQCVSMLGYAAEFAPTGSALAVALDQAWRLHPQAAGLEAREAEARATRDVAGGLTPEPGSVSIGSRNDRLNRQQGKQEYEIELAAPLWLPGQQAARKTEAESRIDDLNAKRAALRTELAGELREAWWSLAAARNAKALALRRHDTARELENDVRRRYQVGELSRIDANLALTEVHAAAAELGDAEATLLQAEQTLRILTGTVAPADLAEEAPATRRNPGAASGTPGEHPLIAAAAAAARSARARLAVADESRRAAPELALRVVRERGDFAEPYANTVGVRLKIPFSSGALVRRETSAAQAEADQAEAEWRRTETRVRLDEQRARSGLQSAEQQFVMARERRELSTENLRLGEKAFALGEYDLAAFLRIRATAYDAEAFLSRQSVARAAAISRLNQALGVLP